MAFRNGFGELNSFVLDSLRGLDETIQYNQGKARQKELDERSVKLASFQKDLSKMEGSQRSITNFSILGFSLVMLLLTMALYHQGEIGFDAMLICTVAIMGSFGPVVALSSLSNNLNQTLASGERVLSILEETPMVEEIPVRSEGEKLAFAGAAAENVSFAYEEEEILKNCSVNIEKGKIIGIHGASGWKIDPSSVVYAFLGRTEGKHYDLRKRCTDNSHTGSSGHGELCNAGDPAVS